MKRPFLAPECLQISSIDCGVAAVATLLAGYGVRGSYERLRRLCQTGVDGTSIDSLEDLCNDVGVEVVQHVVPTDLALAVMEGRFPLIAIVNRVGVIPHFVTVWRRVGPYLQVMDPAGGRRWVHKEEFEKELGRHPLRLPSEDWREWMTSNSFRDALSQRVRALLPAAAADTLAAEVFARRDPEEVAAFDGALRLVAKTARASGRNRPSWNELLFRRAFASAKEDASLRKELGTISPEGDAVTTVGAVLLARPNVEDDEATAPTVGRPATEAAHDGSSSDATREARKAIGQDDEPPSLLRELRQLLGSDGRVLVCWLVVGIVTLTVASTAEILLYRAAIDAPRLFSTLGARSIAAAALASLVLILLSLEAAVSYGAASLGRHLELELRIATLHSLPRVDDDFIRSRPTSDLANRAHSLVTGSRLPASLVAAARAAGDLLVTLVAIAWLDLRYLAPVMIGGAFFALTIVASRARLRELDTRTQVHASRLLTFFLDALRGHRPVRLHGYQDALRSEQQRELELWRATGDALVRTTGDFEAINGLAGIALLVAVFCVFVFKEGDPRVFVLLVFWAFRIPPTIRALVTFAHEYPMQRLALTRLFEVTRYAAKRDPEIGATQSLVAADDERRGVSLSFRDVTLTANQCTILRDVSLDVRAGEHVAIVGRSGSGKSSLVSLLLGFHQPSEGEVHVDGAPLDERRREAVRRLAAWVDPSLCLWNSTIRDNVEYAVRGLPRRPFLEAAEASELLGVLDKADRGLDAPVGPEGSFVSGGEGQRIRLARGLLRANVRLVVLDEAFRGLERTTRERMTRNARALWRDATVLSVSHDIHNALEFPRVLVVEDGRIVEDGDPTELASRPSRFKQLLDAETRALKSLWGDRAWRRLRIAQGSILDESRS